MSQQQQHHNTQHHNNTNNTAPNQAPRHNGDGSSDNHPLFQLPPTMGLWNENLPMGSGGGGWDTHPTTPLSTSQLHPAGHSQCTQPHHAYYPQQPAPHRTWEPIWAPPQPNIQQAPQRIPIPLEGMEQQEKKKDKGKRRATSREMREQTNKERQEWRQELNCLLQDLEREGATLDNDNDMTDSGAGIRGKIPPIQTTVEEASRFEMRSNSPYQPCSVLYCITLRGFPMNPLQVDALADLINNEQYTPDVQFEACELLDVFCTILGWVFPEHSPLVQEEIEAWNASHLPEPFNVQTGPDFVSQQFVCPPITANNIGMADMVTTLIQNSIPIAWIDHAYPFRLKYLNAHFINSPLRQPMFLEADDWRLECLQRYSELREIPQWSGFWSPSPEDFDHIHTLMRIDRLTHRDQARDGRWLSYAESTMFLYLRNRPQPYLPPLAGPSMTSQATDDMGSNDPAMDVEEMSGLAAPHVSLPPSVVLGSQGSNDPTTTETGTLNDAGSNDSTMPNLASQEVLTAMEVDDGMWLPHPMMPQLPPHPSPPPGPPLV
ncbi:hypothetical protein BDQ17DRAFT_1325729 [Cyathus striatus]|nr:hypothetical protein BDQ17DRAFT_1325729 [Cyathus striatus]